MSQDKVRYPSQPASDGAMDPAAGTAMLLDVSELERTFLDLARDWRAATAVLSSTSAKVGNLAYQNIIRLGWPVVPLILKELQRQPEHWFHALTAITGENPIPPEDIGNVRKMADAWIRWGESRGIA